MILNNYKGLRETVVDWLDRQDIADKVDTFIKFTTIDVARELRLPTMERTSIIGVYGDGSAKVPYDLIEARNINWIEVNSDTMKVLSRIPLNRSSFTEYQKSRDNKNLSNKPHSFTRLVRDFKVFPLSNTEDNIKNGVVYNEDLIGYIEVIYYALPSDLKNDTDYNWILQVAPDIYFYGTMYRAYQYVKNLEQAQYWEDKYIKSMKTIQQSSNVSEWAGGPIVVV